VTQESIRKTIESAARDAKRTGADALGAVRNQAQDTFHAAKAMATDGFAARAEEGRDYIADMAGDAAGRLHAKAADDGVVLRARLFDMLATCVSDLASDLRRQDIPQIQAQAEVVARRNPAAFVAGAAIAGFVLARFGHASATVPNAAPGARMPETAPRDLGRMVGGLHAHDGGA